MGSYYRTCGSHSTGVMLRLLVAVSALGQSTLPLDTAAPTVIDVESPQCLLAAGVKPNWLVVTFFHSDRCHSCHEIVQAYEEVAEIMQRKQASGGFASGSRVVLARADVRQHQALATHLGVDGKTPAFFIHRGVNGTAYAALAPPDEPISAPKLVRAIEAAASGRPVPKPRPGSDHDMMQSTPLHTISSLMELQAIRLQYGTVMLLFSAPWCAECATLETQLRWAAAQLTLRTRRVRICIVDIRSQGGGEISSRLLPGDSLPIRLPSLVLVSGGGAWVYRGQVSASSLVAELSRWAMGQPPPTGDGTECAPRPHLGARGSLRSA